MIEKISVVPFLSCEQASFEFSLKRNSCTLRGQGGGETFFSRRGLDIYRSQRLFCGGTGRNGGGVH